MTITVYPADAVAGAPSYTGRELRQAMSALAAGATAARPLGGLSGVRPGSGVVGSATSTTWTVKPHAGQLDLQAAAEASVYHYAIDADTTGSVTAADASNPRVDIVYLTLNDPAEGDGSSAPAVIPGYLAGTPAATPAAPAAPARSMVLFTIAVPKAGGGSPTVSMACLEVGGAGSPIGVRDFIQRDAAITAPYAGLEVRWLGAGDGFRERHNGTTWVPLFPFRQEMRRYTHGSNITAGSIAGPFPQTFAAGRFTQPPNVQVNIVEGSRLVGYALNVTTSGFDLYLRNVAASDSPGGVDIAVWSATQMTPNTATG
jgi:hypothetical protein